MTTPKTNASKLFLSSPMPADEFAAMRKNQAFWEGNARTFKRTNEVSWGDANLMRLEIDAVSAHLPRSKKSVILDAGCSNGFSTFHIASRVPGQFRAFDYSPNSIHFAQEEQQKRHPDARIRFSAGNILNIEEEDASIDAVYTIRVLINLPSWRAQRQALREIHRVLKPNGLYLLSEAFAGSLANLNVLRKAAKLPLLSQPAFNLYLKEAPLARTLERYFEIVEVRKFSSIYYVASRFLRYLTMERGEKDSYDNPINNFFAPFPETGQSGDFGVQKLYVLKKK